MYMMSKSVSYHSHAPGGSCVVGSLVDNLAAEVGVCWLVTTGGSSEAGFGAEKL